MSRAYRLGLVVCAGALAGCGCTSTETGNPPLTPGVELDMIDVTSLAPPMDGGVPGGMTVVLSGGPGTLSSEVDRLLIVPLDRPDPMTVVTPAADGSFSTMLMLANGETVRFQVDEGSRRRPPIDARLDGISFTAVTHPNEGCVFIPAEVIVDATTRATSIRVANTCGDTVTVGGVGARLGGATVDGAGFSLPPGETNDLVVTLTAEEEIVLIAITAPALDRYAVTVR